MYRATQTNAANERTSVPPRQTQPARRHSFAPVTAVAALLAVFAASLAFSPQTIAAEKNDRQPSLKGGSETNRAAPTPPMREDEPAPKDGGATDGFNAEEKASPPADGGGCPYRGRTLELIV